MYKDRLENGPYVAWRAPAAGGGQDAGITQPREHSLADTGPECRPRKHVNWNVSKFCECEESLRRPRALSRWTTEMEWNWKWPLLCVWDRYGRHCATPLLDERMKGQRIFPVSVSLCLRWECPLFKPSAPLTATNNAFLSFFLPLRAERCSVKTSCSQEKLICLTQVY